MDDELMHYGVKGMRWGVRKRERSSGGSKKRKKKSLISKAIKKGKSIVAANAKKKATKKAEEEAEPKIKGGKKSAKTKLYKRNKGEYAVESFVSDMSDADLAYFVKRLSQEQQLKKLVEKPPTKTGKEKVQDFLQKNGKLIVKGVAIAGVLGGAAAIGKKYNLNEKQIENLDKTLQILKILGSG